MSDQYSFFTDAELVWELFGYLDWIDLVNLWTCEPVVRDTFNPYKCDLQWIIALIFRRLGTSAFDVLHLPSRLNILKIHRMSWSWSSLHFYLKDWKYISKCDGCVIFHVGVLLKLGKFDLFIRLTKIV